MKRRDFLVEIGTEELPPRALKTLADAFAAGVAAGLQTAKLKHRRVQRLATPRRLAVLIKGLAEQQPEQDSARRGPPISAAFDSSGEPTRAATAFAQSCGSTVESLQRVTEAKGEFLFFSGRKPGLPARDLLPGIVQSALDALPTPRRMRWGSGEVQFVRPVHWVLMLFGTEVVPASILGIGSGNLTYGHRFHAPRALRISSPGTYLGRLRKRGYVLADLDERREKIRQEVEALAQSLGGEPLASEALYEEVAALVEWPVPIAGRFDPRFLELPREVLTTTLRSHQRYFPIAAAGRLLPHFIAVANLESRDPAQVRAGNERVVRPRLSDAAFFYELDRKSPLASRCAALEQVTFQARLGSLGDKTRRVSGLAQRIAAALDDGTGAAAALATRAATLCKCDLLTAVVGEFPELQGTMGHYYALDDGEPAEVAQAVEEQYLPRFAGDVLPQTRTGMTLAIADKLDTVAGIFAIDQKPTGTRDPFGLRRCALGVLRIVIEQRLPLDLRQLIALAVQQAQADIARITPRPDKPDAPDSLQGVTDQVYTYIMERLRAHYVEGGQAITTEMFDAVLSVAPAEPLDFDARLRGLESFLRLPEASSLTAANKRIANILRQAGDQVPEGAPDPQVLQQDAERALFAELSRLQSEVTRLFTQRNYDEGLRRLAALRTPVDAFFDSVMVMDEDLSIRANRLKLLRALRALFLEAADLSRLPG